MRLFAADIRKALEEGADASRLARALLAYAVREQWGISCPETARLANGKPFFPGERDKFFSLSHTKTHILGGVSHCDLGVDAETRRPVRPGAAERLFSPAMRRDFGYFEGWTLRESVYKLTGRGSLRRMEFSLSGGEIRAPFPEVRCRLYGGLHGCAAAAAADSDDFPEAIELVPTERFWP